MLCCDNKRALEVSSHHTRRSRPSAKCADIRRSLKAVTPLLNGTFHYVHVYGHMDHMLKWEQLTLTQQINCVCDTLAKRSLTTAINHGYHECPTQLLPKEDVALVVTPTYGFTQVRRWHGSIWPVNPEINGPTTASTQWIGNTWTLLSRTSPICTKSGGQNSTPGSAAQGFRWGDIWVTFLRTRDAQIADNEKRLPT